jgi:hypothetical protein
MAVVVRFSRTRKRYERLGILVEEAALERAEEQCLADEDVRERRRERARERRGDEDLELQSRMAKEIRRLYPGCPVERAEAIARRAGARGSGRVGRIAAGRALDEDAIKGAVVASVRHEETGYDTLVMAGYRGWTLASGYGTISMPFWTPGEGAADRRPTRFGS